MYYRFYNKPNLEKEEVKNMNSKAKKVALSGVAIALIFVATRFTQVPVPLGYTHLGDGFIFLFGTFLDPVSALLVAALGGALADLTSGYALWAIPTFITKGLMGLVVGFAAKSQGSKKGLFLALGVIAGIVINVLGYFVFGIFLYGGVLASLTQIPSLILEGVVGGALFYILYFALKPVRNRIKAEA